MPGGVTYGKDYVPWQAHVDIGDAQTTNGNGVLGSWGQITASSAYGFYPTTVAIAQKFGTAVFEIGYGPAGAERTIAAGIAGIPLATTDFIPKGSRVAVRWSTNAAAAAQHTGVSGIRGDLWGPDPTLVGPKHASVTPSLSPITATTSGVAFTSAVPYPFVLTTAYVAGLTGAATGQVVSIRVGASGSETIVVSLDAGRPDNLGSGIYDFKPRPLPIAAGSRITGWTSFGTSTMLIAGYRLDY